MSLIPFSTSKSIQHQLGICNNSWFFFLVCICFSVVLCVLFFFSSQTSIALIWIVKSPELSPTKQNLVWLALLAWHVEKVLCIRRQFSDCSGELQIITARFHTRIYSFYSISEIAWNSAVDEQGEKKLLKASYDVCCSSGSPFYQLLSECPILPPAGYLQICCQV